jgi:hypothetical protein
MRAFLALGAFIGAYWVANNLPLALGLPVGLLFLAGIFAGAVALAVKWVRNV